MKFGVHAPQIDLQRRSATAQCRERGHSTWREARLHLAPPLAVALVLTAFSAFLLHRSEAVLSVDRLALLFGGAAVVVLSGQLLVELAAPRPFAGRLVIATIGGYTVSTAALLFGVFVCGSDVVTSFAAWSLLVAVAYALAWRSRRTYPRRFLQLDLVMLAVPAAVICFFCRDMAAAVSSIERTGVLPLWVDYFIHGAEVAQFSVVGPAGAGDIFLAGLSLPLYHYGTYLLPALLQALFDLSGLAAACAFLLPLGLLLACAGALSLAVRLGGLWAGLLALALLLLVPAGASYGLNNTFFDFHWLMFTAPGTGYGMATATAALVLMERAYVDRGFSATITAAFLVLALFQIRVQIFVLLAPPLLAFAMLMVPAAHAPHWRRTAFAAAIVSLGLLVLLWSWPGLLDFVVKLSGATTFLDNLVHEVDNSLGYRDLYQHVSSWPHPWANIVRAVLLIPLIFGYLLFILPAMMALGRSPRLRWAEALFLIVAFWQLALLAFAPAGQNGDASEYAHRPFPLLYMLAVILLAAHSVRALRLRVALPPMAVPVFAGTATLVGVSAVVLATATAFDPARSAISWSSTFYRPVVDRGLVALARDLKARAAPGETVAVGPIDPNATLIDKGIILASLADRAIYLTVPGLQIIGGGDRALEAKRRLKAQREAEKTFVEGGPLPARSAWGVAWYVDTSGADRAARSPDGAVFANSSGRIYRIKP